MSLADDICKLLRLETEWEEPTGADPETGTDATWLVVDDQLRPPLLAEAEALLRRARELGRSAVRWRYVMNDAWNSVDVIELHRCDCADGNVILDNAASCRACSAVAQMLTYVRSERRHPEDRAARYELAERTLLRLERVVAQLKREQGGAP